MSLHAKQPNRPASAVSLRLPTLCKAWRPRRPVRIASGARLHKSAAGAELNRLAPKLMHGPTSGPTRVLVRRVTLSSLPATDERRASRDLHARPKRLTGVPEEPRLDPSSSRRRHILPRRRAPMGRCWDHPGRWSSNTVVPRVSACRSMLRVAPPMSMLASFLLRCSVRLFAGYRTSL